MPPRYGEREEDGVTASDLRGSGWLSVAAGAVAVIVGLLVGFWPHSNGQVQGTLFADTCGSAFLPNASATQGLVPCSYYLDGPRAWAIGLLIVGAAVVLLGLILLGQASEKRTEDLTGTASDTAPSPHAGISEELQRLTDLHDRGALSDEEYEAGKRRVLGMGQ